MKPQRRYGWPLPTPEETPRVIVEAIWTDPNYTPRTGFEIYGDGRTDVDSRAMVNFMKWYDERRPAPAQNAMTREEAHNWHPKASKKTWHMDPDSPTSLIAVKKRNEERVRAHNS